MSLKKFTTLFILWAYVHTLFASAFASQSLEYQEFLRHYPTRQVVQQKLGKDFNPAMAFVHEKYEQLRRNPSKQLAQEIVDLITYGEGVGGINKNSCMTEAENEEFWDVAGNVFNLDVLSNYGLALEKRENTSSNYRQVENVKEAFYFFKYFHETAMKACSLDHWTCRFLMEDVGYKCSENEEQFKLEQQFFQASLIEDALKRHPFFQKKQALLDKGEQLEYEVLPEIKTLESGRIAVIPKPVYRKKVPVNIIESKLEPKSYHHTWNESNQVIPKPVVALGAIAASVATGGTLTPMVGPILGAGLATAAGITTSQFLTHGDPIKSVEVLGKKESLQNIGVSMATAATLQGLQSHVNLNPSLTLENPTYLDQLKAQGVKSMVRGSYEVLIANKSIEDTFYNELKNIPIQAFANHITNKVGQKIDDETLKHIAHFSVAAVSDIALGGNSTTAIAGGISAVVGEIAAQKIITKELIKETAEQIRGNIQGITDEKTREDIIRIKPQILLKPYLEAAELIGTSASVFFGERGVQSGQQASQRTVENNCAHVIIPAVTWCLMNPDKPLRALNVAWRTGVALNNAFKKHGKFTTPKQNTIKKQTRTTGGNLEPEEPKQKKTIKVNQLNKQIQRNQAPRGIERVDNVEENGQIHVHFKDGSALNCDGTWRHGFSQLTKEIKEWLLQNGWVLPQ